MLAALEDLEYELIALFSGLSRQRIEVFDGGRLERLEAVALVHTLDDSDHVFAATDVFRQEVAHAARWFGARRHYSLGSVKPCCFWYLPFLSA